MVKLKQVTTRRKDKRKVGRTTEALSLTTWQNQVIKKKQLQQKNKWIFTTQRLIPNGEFCIWKRQGNKLQLQPVERAKSYSAWVDYLCCLCMWFMHVVRTSDYLSSDWVNNVPMHIVLTRVILFFLIKMSDNFFMFFKPNFLPQLYNYHESKIY